MIGRATSGVRSVLQVVLVDDHTDTREMIAELLDSAGYAVRAFADGAAALDYLVAADELPSVVLTDLKMPRMDGAQLVRAMGTHPRLSAIPVLIMTANDGFTCDGVPVLAKPVPTDALLEKVATLLARPAATSGTDD